MGDVIKQLYHSHANPSTIILAKILMMFVSFIIPHKSAFSWTLFSQYQTAILNDPSESLGPQKACGPLAHAQGALWLMWP